MADGGRFGASRKDPTLEIDGKLVLLLARQVLDRVYELWTTDLCDGHSGERQPLKVGPGGLDPSYGSVVELHPPVEHPQLVDLDVGP